jgi:hypothetical protein
MKTIALVGGGLAIYGLYELLARRRISVHRGMTTEDDSDTDASIAAPLSEPASEPTRSHVDEAIYREGAHLRHRGQRGDVGIDALAETDVAMW